jgi:hypothetical protein
MSQDVEMLFPASTRHQTFPQALQALQERLRTAPTVKYRERLAALHGLSEVLLRRSTALPTTIPPVGLPFLTSFLQQINLEHLVAREIPDPQALEHFVPAGDRKSLRLLPKGLVCHWIAGNVPLLGMFSWAISALLGNMNVVRLSTRQDDFMSPLLGLLATVSEAGRHMAEETVLARFARDNRTAHQHMSAVANVRIAWGGLEAIEAIRALPAHWECEDIVLGPRVSLAVVDPAAVTDSVVSRLATDAVFFDQLACTSPQYIFVKGWPGEGAFEAFVERFTAAFARQAMALPRHELDFAETYQVQLDRTRLLLEGAMVRRDPHTQWTLALVTQPHEKVICANRFVQLIPFKSLEVVLSHMPSNIQTVITALSEAESQQFTEEAAHYGVCRFPRPGEGNHFETPWDGLPLVSRLTRWVVKSNPRTR